MNKVKRITSVVLVFMMVLMMLPISLVAYADAGVNTDQELFEMFGYNSELVDAVKRAAKGTDDIYNVKSLTDVELSKITTLVYTGSRQLTAIPSTGFDKLTSLASLTLRNQSITNLSGFTANNVASLTSLDVSNNSKLTDISGISILRNLTSLNISNCAVTSLEGITTLNKLTSIKANNNKISSMQPIYGLGMLNTLDLSNNIIWRIEGVTRLTNLKTLNLSGNRISKIEDITYFQGPNAITNLDLSNNMIKSINSDCLTMLSKISVLNLDRNRLPKSELMAIPFSGSANIAAIVGTQYNVNIKTSIPTDISQTLLFNYGSDGIVVSRVRYGSNTYNETVLTDYTIISSNTNVAEVIKSTGFYQVRPVNPGAFNYLIAVDNTSILLQAASVSSSSSTAITINERPNPNIELNGRKLLSVTVSPSNDSFNSYIEWTSSDVTILRVSPNSGNDKKALTATVESTGRAGVAYITAKIMDGSNKSDTMQVKVIEPVKNISFVSPQNQMRTDDVQMLTLLYEPANATSKEVTFISSDANIVSVDNTGRVVAKKPGTATITATTIGNDISRTANLVINVIDGEMAVKLDKKPSTIYVEQEFKINATVYPSHLQSENVVWTSDDPNIASVDQTGLVIGKSLGKTIITAKLVRDDEIVSTAITITVAEPEIKVIALDPDLSMTPGMTKKVTYSILPEEIPSKKVLFSSSNESVASISTDGTITAKQGGQATITIQSIYGTRFTATVNVIVTPNTPTLSLDRSGNSVVMTAGDSKGATRYRYYVKTKPSEQYTRIGDTTSKNFKVTGLTEKATYYFAVRAYTVVNGVNIYSGYRKVTSKYVPEKPKFSYVKSGTSVTLNVTSTDPSAKYVYYMKTNLTDSFTRISTGTTKTSFTKTGLVKGKTYYFTVKRYENVNGVNVYSGATTVSVKI